MVLGRERKFGVRRLDAALDARGLTRARGRRPRDVRFADAWSLDILQPA
jgi:hypothetical protein